MQKEEDKDKTLNRIFRLLFHLRIRLCVNRTSCVLNPEDQDGRPGTCIKSRESMHRELQGWTSASRRRRTIAHSKQIGVQAVNFEVGDFVLLRRSSKAGHKLQFTLQGPRRI